MYDSRTASVRRRALLAFGRLGAQLEMRLRARMGRIENAPQDQAADEPRSSLAGGHGHTSPHVAGVRPLSLEKHRRPRAPPPSGLCGGSASTNLRCDEPFAYGSTGCTVPTAGPGNVVSTLGAPMHGSL